MDGQQHGELQAAERQLVTAVGRFETSAEDAAIAAATGGVLRFSRQHPVLYALIAFAAGGGVTALLIVLAYRNWTFQHIDLVQAVYTFVFGSLAGGIVAMLLARAYVAMLKTVVRRE